MGLTVKEDILQHRDEYFAWGLHQIAKAVSFLNNDCKLVLFDVHSFPLL